MIKDWRSSSLRTLPVSAKDGWLVIPKPLQVHAVKWHHNYLQHPGHTRLKERMNAAMYWKGMCTTIRSISRSCRSCQTNKRQKLKFRHLLSKTIISNPWECLCVDLIGPYTLNSLTAIRFRREQKHPPCRIPMVEIVQKVPSTTNTTFHKHHHHGKAVCPSYGMGLMDLPNPTQVTSSEGVGWGRYCRVLYGLIN